MIMRRFVAYLPKLISRMFRDYGQYDRKGFMPGPVFYDGMSLDYLDGFDGLKIQRIGINPTSMIWEKQLSNFDAKDWGISDGFVDGHGFFYPIEFYPIKLDVDAQLMWSYCFGEKPVNLPRPAIDSEGNAYFNGDEFRHKIDKHGKIIWTVMNEGRSKSRVALTQAEDFFYATGVFNEGGDINSAVAKIKALDGSIEWAQLLANGRSQHICVDSNDNVYVASSTSGRPAAGYDPNAVLLWSNTDRHYAEWVMGPDNYIYATGYAATRRMYKVNPADGSVVWTSSFSLPSVTVKIFFIGAECHLVVGWPTSDGGHYTVNTDTGARTQVRDFSGYTYDFWPIRSFGRQVNSKPYNCKADYSDLTGYILLCADQNRVSKYKEDMALVWTKKLEESANAVVHAIDVDSEGNVFAVDGAGYCYKLDKDGEELWKFHDADYSVFHAVCADGSGGAFVGGNSGDLIKISAEGQESWTSAINYSRVMGIQLDAGGDIYIANYDGMGFLSKVNPDGSHDSSVQIEHGGGGGEPEEEFWFWYWQYDHRARIFLDKGEGKIYVGGLGYDAAENQEAPQCRVYNLSMAEIARLSLNPGVNAYNFIFDLGLDLSKNIIASVMNNETGEANIIKIDPVGLELEKNKASRTFKFTSLAVDSQGNTYASCHDNHMVLRYKSNGDQDENWVVIGPETGINDIKLSSV